MKSFRVALSAATLVLTLTIGSMTALAGGVDTPEPAPNGVMLSDSLPPNSIMLADPPGTLEVGEEPTLLDAALSFLSGIF